MAHEKESLTIDAQLCQSLFDELASFSRDDPGMTRPAYGEAESRAHACIREAGRALGLGAQTDAAGNLYLSLPGADTSLPVWMVGSHLDTVPHGGNFDGAAGVIGGLAAIAALVRAGLKQKRTVVLAAFRAEESTWFPASYIGSRAAFGCLEVSSLDLARMDTGRTLRSHIAECGFDPGAVAAGQAHLEAGNIHGFVEMHIEQGPRLEEAGLPVGIVTGISGSFRYRKARCLGTYAHSGAVDRADRNDAVFAFADLVCGLDELWTCLDAEGRHATITFGEVATNPALHAFSKVPGEVTFCLDVRSTDQAVLALIEEALRRTIANIMDRRGVRFDLGERTGSTAAAMDCGLVDILSSQAKALDIPHRRMISGAGHDAAVLANQGVASAMIFIRNQHGSHNPRETMDISDLCVAARLVAHVVAEPDGLTLSSRYA
jgi:N-carbamoyl-L-amino-acid hydrolase